MIWTAFVTPIGAVVDKVWLSSDRETWWVDFTRLDTGSKATTGIAIFRSHVQDYVNAKGLPPGTKP